VTIKKIEQLVSRERRIFKFLVFYLFLALFLVFLFVNCGGWIFIETAILVLVIEITITGLVKRGKPLHTNEDVCKELSKLKEADEYTELRDEYMRNKGNTISISLTVYSLGSIALLFLKNFNMVFVALYDTGLMILYFSIYLFFRYKINRITIILLQRMKVIREMKKKEKSKKLKRGIKKIKKMTERRKKLKKR